MFGYYEFINFKGVKTSVLVTLKDKTIINWTEYSNDYIGVFHDNSPLNINAVNGKTANKMQYREAITLLHTIADKTGTCKYGPEINGFIYAIKDDMEVPF